ncbi:hypothetical protein L226DRAFT_48380 [Lentinus tigrinus ALCF2SS1-7]|uniref:uncharacterized protein n=1 Tax=Lentinus tigrinus ALCF2SS1-7 TaxID=1328758 RepID=UPI0011660473|nr:hypothetical protein L226DRAFT_48380 [Lentinus tigrinus ALCF2SS1-7]
MRSPLRLRVAARPFWTPRRYDLFLGHLAPTLETLELPHICLTDDSPSTRTLTRYGSVRSLSIVIHSIPLLEPLLDWVPAVSFLDVGELYDGIKESECEGIRSRNIHIQAVRGPWRELRRLTCSPVMLYTLAPTCPIRHLYLHWTFPSNCKECPSPTQILRQDSISRLTLTFNPLKNPRVFSVLHGFSPPSLTHLNLCMVFAAHGHKRLNVGETWTLRWKTVFEMVLCTLRPLHSLQLTHVRIVVHCDIRLPPARRTLHPYTNNLMDAVRHLNFGCAAAELARSSPSLEFVVLTTSINNEQYGDDIGGREQTTLERWSVTRGWQRTKRSVDGVSRGESRIGMGEQSLRELPPESVDKLVKAEDLWVSERDKTSYHMDPLMQ